MNYAPLGDPEYEVTGISHEEFEEAMDHTVHPDGYILAPSVGRYYFREGVVPAVQLG